MWFSTQARRRWRALIERRRLDRDLDEEIRFHLEMKALRNRDSGMAATEAMYAARREFGNASKWKENIRDMWTWTTLESWMQDVRYAVRSLRHSSAFAITALLVLALGIASTTSIFSVVNAVILRPLPFPDPDRLVLLWGNVQRQKVERRGASYPDYQDWRAQAKTLEGMAAFTDQWFTLTGMDETERVRGEWASAGYFELLGVKPVLGRTVTSDEDIVGKAAPLVVIGEGVWKRRFGSDPNILGRQVHVNQRLCTVIGVMPAWFRGISDNAEMWAPFAGGGSAQDFGERGARGFVVLARLKPGVPVREAQAEFDAISKRLEQAYPGTNAKRGVEVASLPQETVGDLRAPLFVLLGAVALVLLIACANVANLLLARSEARRHELAIRTALGAGRGRVLRQLVTESLLLSVAGAALGLAGASAVVRIVAASSPIDLPSFVDPRPDWAVAAFAAVISAVVGVAVGVVPALLGFREDPNDTLKETARTGDGASRQRFRASLVVAESALAMALLVGAGLLIRSFQNLARLDPGFEPGRVLTFSAALPRPDPPQPGMSQPDQRTVISGRQLVARIKTLPSVVSASVSTDTPLEGGGNAIFYSVEGQNIDDAKTRPRAYVHRVSPEFFATLQAKFAAGRTFTEQEISARSDVAIVTESLVKRFWPGQDPIGKRIKGGGTDSTAPWWTIVGVVRDMKFRGLPDNPTADPDVFLPFSERQRNIAILVRTSLNPADLSGAVRAAVRDVDPTIPVYNVAPMSERVGKAIARPRFAGWAMTLFAALALALASVGLYGVMAYTVSRRTRELGVRIAMGARPTQVVAMVLGRGMSLAGLGIAIGIAAALGLSRLLRTMLYGVGPADPATLGAVAALLAGVAFLACYVPARRASHIDPVTALRHE